MKYLKLLMFTLLFFSIVSPAYAASTIGKAGGNDVDVDFTSLITRVPNLKITTLDGFLNNLLPYLLTFAGLILFGMLLMGGFEMLTAATDSKKADAGKTRITQAVIGFIIIFCAYWIAQIVEIILGVSILK